jgi:hypothetical protein
MGNPNHLLTSFKFACTLKNDERKLAVLVAAIIAFSALSGVAFVSAKAPTNTGNPAFLQAWLTAHPNFQGCLEGSLTAGTVEVVPCSTNLPIAGMLYIPSAVTSGSAQPLPHQNR